MRAALLLSLVMSLYGCSASPSVEPSKVGAKNECAALSANLPQYNECLERVDTHFEKYKQAVENDERN